MWRRLVIVCFHSGSVVGSQSDSGLVIDLSDTVQWKTRVPGDKKKCLPDDKKTHRVSPDRE